MGPVRVPLTPLERLQVRDALQDRWREQVRLITVLSLARYDGDNVDGVASLPGAAAEESALDGSIARARAQLEDLEQAMHRLDNRSYGYCQHCREPIGFARLAQIPETTSCEACQPASDALAQPTAGMSVA